MSIGGSNGILAALPASERDRVLLCSERVVLTQQDTLGEPGERIREVYFPTAGYCVLQTPGKDHEVLGVGLIGSTGMLGTALLLGADTSPLRAQVMGDGSALRIDAEEFRRLLIGAPVLEYQLRIYLHTQMTQCAQIAACVAFHVLAARLASWLLAIHDLVDGDRFYLTHDLLARALGVHRSGVSTAAGVLQKHRLIAYTRGHIVIRDRKGLEQAACGCYRDTCADVRATQPQLKSTRPLAGSRREHAKPEIERRHHPRLGAASRRAGPPPVV